MALNKVETDALLLVRLCYCLLAKCNV